MLSGCLGAEGAKSGRLIANFMDPYGLARVGAPYTSHLGEFDELDVGFLNEWASVHPDQNTWHLDDITGRYNMVKDSPAVLKGGLVWAHDGQKGSLHIPTYLNALSPDQVRAELRNYFATLMQHYPRITVWTVANEPFTLDGSGNYVLHDNVFQKKLGNDWIREALQIAYQLEPHSTFIAINETAANTDNDKADKMLDYYRNRLVGVMPNDHLAVGLEMHLDNCPDGSFPSTDAIGRNIRRFGNLGIKVHITEMDVAIRCVGGTVHHTVDQHMLDVQRRVYHDVVASCVAVPNCNTIGFFGVGDPDSWIRYFQGHTDWPLLFDDNYQPKPAYAGVVDALNGR
jgi:endo-1,4-beta-xylanase